MSSIKNIIPEEIKQKIHLLSITDKDPQWMEYSEIKSKRVFVFLAGFYQNLGDMAITYAQIEFLKKQFPEATVICVPSTQTYSSIKTIKTFIRNDDLISITGGGNMDENYPSLENARLHVVKSFPNNRIISFPQTIFFSGSKNGRKMANKSKKVYSKHQALTIFVREPVSFKKCSLLFPRVDARLVPDIVLSLSGYHFPEAQRKNVLFCCRSDRERLNDIEFNDRLLLDLRGKYDKVTIRDTVDVNLSDCTQERYESTLHFFWDLLCNCKVAVTDRLHCMLFCVITKTPCVVMDNSNHKVSGVYDAWLKNVPYIRLVKKQKIQDILTAIDSIANQDFSNYDLNFDKEFEPLRRALHEQ